MMVYFSAVISGRLIWLAAAQIVTDIGTYFSIWRCDEVLNLLSDPQALQSTYPQCVVAGVNPAAVWVAVHASARDGPLYYASALHAVNGMSLWVATLIHIVAVEFFLRADKTESSNQVRLGFVLEP
ncbi:hypothetical protein DFH07DRAFT_979991, partial [Mycena maculata]